MNEQNFDKLFREKLIAYTQTPPPGSMEMLSEKLKHRSQKAWVKFGRLAAALVLIAVSVYLVSNWANLQNEQLPLQVAGNQPAVLEEQTIPEPSVVPEKSEVPVPENNQKTVASAKVTAPRSNDQQSNEVAIQATDLQEDIPVAAIVAANEDEKSSTTEEQPTASPLADTKSESTKPKRGKVTITYKRSPAPKEPQLALQQQTQRKSKRLKKFLNKAQKVDYQSFSLAGIRATKDQLLAINKKEKSKETKSN